MSHRSTSILGLLAVVGTCALGFVALRSASPLWADAFGTFTVGFLLVAVILARFRRGREGAFWFGFAVFGWGIFLLAAKPLGDDLPEGLGGMFRPPGDAPLVTRFVLFLLNHVRPETDDLQKIDPILAKTVRIISLILTLGLATCGGVIAIVARRRRRPPGASADKVPVTSLLILAGLTAASVPAWLADFPRPIVVFDPDPTIGEIPERSEFRVRLDSTFFRTTGEAPIWSTIAKPADSTTYRMFWSTSFHHAVFVQIRKKPVGASVRAIVFDRTEGETGYDAGMAIDRQVDLSEREWARLEQAVEASRFWVMPSKPKSSAIHPDDEDISATDGDGFDVEGVKDHAYRRVGRANIEGENSPFLALCHHMLVATGLKVDEAWAEYHSTIPVVGTGTQGHQ